MNLTKKVVDAAKTIEEGSEDEDWSVEYGNPVESLSLVLESSFDSRQETTREMEVQEITMEQEASMTKKEQQQPATICQQPEGSQGQMEVEKGEDYMAQRIV